MARKGDLTKSSYVPESDELSHLTRNAIKSDFKSPLTAKNLLLSIVLVPALIIFLLLVIISLSHNAPLDAAFSDPNDFGEIGIIYLILALLMLLYLFIVASNGCDIYVGPEWFVFARGGKIKYKAPVSKLMEIELGTLAKNNRRMMPYPYMRISSWDGDNSVLKIADPKGAITFLENTFEKLGICYKRQNKGRIDLALDTGFWMGGRVPDVVYEFPSK